MFTKANIGGWSVGAPLTSSQQNTLDTDHSNSVNGGSAPVTQTDTIWTQLTLGPGGTLTAAFSNQILATADTSIKSVIEGGISTPVSGGIRSTAAAGGFELAGGANDWPSCNPSRNRGIFAPMIYQVLQSGFNLSGTSLQGHATAQQQVILLPRMHTGATLSTVQLTFAVLDPHSAGVASLTMPSVRVQRQYAGIGVAPGTFQDLSTTAIQSVPTPGSGAAWNAGGLQQPFIYICNQNNVSSDLYAYTVTFTDETGTGAISGSNFFLGFVLGFTGITNMQFA